MLTQFIQIVAAVVRYTLLEISERSDLMAKKTFEFSLTDTETFTKILEILKEIISDERIPNEIIDGYADRVNEVISKL